MDEKQLTELRLFFEKVTLPKSIQLDAGTTIIDIPKFIDSHMNVLRSGNKAMTEIFSQRLLRLKASLEKPQ
jgi:hypothetical protein